MTARATRVGVALTGHHLALADTLRLARLADAHGYALILVDGDEARVARRPEAPLYDGTALCAGVLAHTRRIHAGSIRLPGFSHVAQVARALSTLQSLGDGRAVGFFGIGSGRHVSDLGLPSWKPAERIAALDEGLQALRALWQRDPVRMKGRFVELHDITAPPPQQAIPIVVAAARPRALAVVARRADVWDANLPPLRRLLEPARQHLDRQLETWLWVFARPGASEDEAIRAYHKHCPWFPPLAAHEYRDALLFGDPRSWPSRLEQMREALQIDLPILDLIGLPAAAAHTAIVACGPAQPEPMA